jgi:hypothetical protein
VQFQYQDVALKASNAASLVTEPIRTCTLICSGSESDCPSMAFGALMAHNALSNSILLSCNSLDQQHVLLV